MLRSYRFVCSVVCSTLVLVGCEVDGEEPAAEDASGTTDLSSQADGNTLDTSNGGAETPAAGFYADQYDTIVSISDEVWIQLFPGSDDPGVYLVESINAEEGYLVAHNDPNNQFSPDLWSRFDFVQVSGEWLYCQSAYDAATAADAEATEAADASDPSNAGCGGGGWSELNPSSVLPTDLEGHWIDQFGTNHHIHGNQWQMMFDGSDPGVFQIAEIDEAGFFIARNSVDNAFAAGLWSRFDYVEDNGNYWFCQTAYDAATFADAASASAPDASNPETSGCAGVAWSSLTAPM
ncbi:MAG: hypothetical protein KC561_05690 [Myxococcales bacterium]|nr:hypothetical protein [Myxococcales bacterium]